MRTFTDARNCMSLYMYFVMFWAAPFPRMRMGRSDKVGDWTGRRVTQNRPRDISTAAEGDSSMFRIPQTLWKGTLAVLIAAVFGLVLSSAGSAGAAEVPSMQITVTDGGYAVRPEIAAGKYQVTIENLSGQSVDLMLVRIPDGMSTAEVQAVLVTGTGKLGRGAIEQSVIAAAQSADMVYLGQAAPHSQGNATVTLETGTWVVISGSAGMDSTFAEFTVGSAG
jgi:hypothetical protein